MTQRIIRESLDVLSDIGEVTNKQTLVRESVDAVSSIGSLQNKQTDARNVVDSVNSIRELRNFPQAYRNTVDVVGSAAKFGKGFIVPLIELATSFTYFFVFSPEGWAGNGKNVVPFVGLTPNEGIFFKESTDTTKIEVVVQFGTVTRAVGVIPVTTLNGKHIVSILFTKSTGEMVIRFDRGASTLTLTLSTSEAYRLRYICGVLQSDEKQAHQIPQILLYASEITLPIREAVENYLYCKWVTPGPDETNNFCVPN